MGGIKRTVTVLFTDLVGSTELMAALEPGTGDELRSHHFAGLRGALAVHAGREVKTLGDGFMAVFDSASDGLSCAVTMQRAVARQNNGREANTLGMRVGLSAGEVTEDDGDYFGLPVIEASRLCDAAGPGQVLASDLVRLLAAGSEIHRLESVGTMTLKGLPQPISVHEVSWDTEEDFALRVALADDSVLLRQGVAQMLESEGMEVVLQTDDADTLLARLPAARPHVAVIDMRMPPTHTIEGLQAAERIRSDHPGIGVLVLSAELQTAAAKRLLTNGTEGVGYMLKDRVAQIGDLAAAIRSVASGGSAIDEEIAAQIEAAA
jgi:class 3 adenylate cyclase